MVELHKQSIKIATAYISLCTVFFLLVRGGWQETATTHLSLFFEPLRVSALSLARAREQLAVSVSLPWHQAQEIRELKVRYALLMARQQELEHVLRENESLKKMLDMPVLTRKEQRVASVYSYTFPALASGRNAGLAEGMSVLADGVLVGTIIEVKESTARVELLQSRPSDEAVLVQTELGVLGLMTSKLGRLIVTHIPLSAQVRGGDKVFTVGQEGIAPRKVIGIVHSVKDDPHAGIREAEIVQPSTFFSTAIVTVE